MAISKKKKKKNIITIIVLLVLLAGLGIGLAVLNQKEKADAEKESTTAAVREKVIPFESEDIVRLEYRVDGETITFVRKNSDDIWVVEGKEKVALTQTTVNSIINYSLMMTEVEVYAEKLDDAEDFGLNSESDYAVFTTAAGESCKLWFGITTPSASGYYYANVDGTEKIIAVLGTAKGKMLTDINNFMQEASYPSLAVSDLVEVIYTDKNQSFEMYNDPADLTESYAIGTTTWYYPYKGRYMAANYDECLEMLNTIVDLSFDDCVELEVNNNLDEFGLDDPFGKLTVKYAITDEVTFETEEGVVIVLIGNLSEDGSKRYFMTEGDNKVYQVDAATLGLLTDNLLTDYLMSIYPALCNFAGVDSIDVECGDRTINIVVNSSAETGENGEENVTYECFINGEAAEEKETRSLFANLIRMSADHILKDGEAKDADEVLFRCTYHTHYKDRPEIVYEVSAFDGTYYQVSLDGDTKYAITKLEYNTLLTNMEAYLK